MKSRAQARHMGETAHLEHLHSIFTTRRKKKKEEEKSPRNRKGKGVFGGKRWKEGKRRSNKKQEQIKIL